MNTTETLRPRIGILGGHYLYENMVVVLRNLHEMVGDRFQLDLLTSASNVPDGLTERYNLVYTQRNFFLDHRSYRTNFSLVRRYVNEYDPDLLTHVSHPNKEGLVVALSGWWHGVTSLVRMTGDSYLEPTIREGRWEQLKSWFIHELCPDMSYRWADCVLALGPALRRRLESVGIDRDRIKELAQPFDERRFQIEQTAEELRDQLELPRDKTIVLFVGRLSRPKGADRLLTIARKVLDRRDDIDFCLVGQGGYTDQFRSLSSDRIHLSGQVQFRRIPKYYRASDCFVFPSRVEGLPNVILEALAANLPVMATPVGEIPTLVDELADDPDRYVDWICSNEKRETTLPERYGWDHQREQYTKLFEKLTGSSQ